MEISTQTRSLPLTTRSYGEIFSISSAFAVIPKIFQMWMSAQQDFTWQLWLLGDEGVEMLGLLLSSYFRLQYAIQVKNCLYGCVFPCHSSFDY